MKRNKKTKMSALLQEFPLEQRRQVCCQLVGEGAELFNKFMEDEHLQIPAEAARKLILDQLYLRKAQKKESMIQGLKRKG